MIPITGLYESHLTVSDLSRSIEFYRDVVGLELAHTVPQRHAAFFWVGGRDRSMLGLWSIHSSPIHLRLHIAFQTGLDQVIRSIEVLRSKGVVPGHHHHHFPQPERRRLASDGGFQEVDIVSSSGTRGGLCEPLIIEIIGVGEEGDNRLARVGAGRHLA